MIIVIKSENTRHERTSKGTDLRKQEAAIDSGSDFPLRFELTVDQPYKPGKYTLAGSAFRVGRFGGLELDPYGIKLEPLS